MQATARPTVALDDLTGLIGQQIGVSQWHTVTQHQIDYFAEATGDDQWLHVDLERAKAGPFGRTIAHGYLTLSLAPMLLWDAVEVTGVSKVLNYGIDRVRFQTRQEARSAIFEYLECFNNPVRLHSKLQYFSPTASEQATEPQMS